MRLTNRVSNVFFALIGLLSLFFMPIISYEAALAGADSFSVYNLISLAKSSSGTGSISEIISSFATYGYKKALLLAVGGLIAAIIGLLLVVILAFIKKTPYIVNVVITAVSFAGVIVSDVFLGKICRGIVSGVLPLSVFTASNNQSFLMQLFGSFTGVSSASTSYGYMLAYVTLSIILIINIIYFVLRKKIAVLDGEDPDKNKISKKSKKK